MNEKELINYYNKFNEDKRLNTKHGQIEYLTSMKYIHKYLKKYNNPKIIDIGAGTGKYSIELYNEGYDVTSVELVKHNLKVIESKNKNIKTLLGNATNLKKIKDNFFEIVILFGPMYHLISKQEKIKALMEAKRIVKRNGIIFVSYCMNEYALITYGFIENHIKDSINNKLIDNNFKITPKNNDLYSFMRIEEIDELNKIVDLKRIKIISQDSSTEYIKKIINNMDDETFNIYLNYHYSICERKELLGAGRHVLDIITKL